MIQDIQFSHPVFFFFHCYRLPPYGARELSGFDFREHFGHVAFSGRSDHTIVLVQHYTHNCIFQCALIVHVHVNHSLLDCDLLKDRVFGYRCGPVEAWVLAWVQKLILLHV